MAGWISMGARREVKVTVAKHYRLAFRSEKSRILKL